MKQETPESPSYYEANGMRCIDVINAYSLNFQLGNVIKYVLRAGRKTPSALEDLQKAKCYIQFEIDRIKKGENK